MSGTSRKVKNPLLTAAGVGFPFENYAENPLLVPVTPATPAVLRDDAELDSFVGQEVKRSQSSAPLCSTVHLSPDNATPAATGQPEVPKDPSSQPAKQGYFTSILSSLPNLNLLSAKAESSATPQGQTIGSRPQEAQPFPPEHYGQSATTLGAFQATHFPEPPSANFAVPGAAPVPPQQTLPPTVPSAVGGPVSYRLGNQRRLKYAPPPDLTTSESKQYLPPTVQSFHSQQNVAPPSGIFNPGTSGDNIYNPSSQVTSVSASRPAEQSDSFQGSRPPSNPVLVPGNSSVEQIPRVGEAQSSLAAGFGQQSNESNAVIAPPVVPCTTYKPLSSRIYEPPALSVASAQIGHITVSKAPLVLTSEPNLQNNTFQWSKPPAVSNLGGQDSSLGNVLQPAESNPVTSSASNSSQKVFGARGYEATVSQITKSPSFEQLSQGSSLQGSFRSSPTGTRAPSVAGLTPQSSYSELASALGPPGIPVSGQRPIPARIVEPATPQNTPATGFSGFAAYARERELSSYSDNLGVLLENSNPANEANPQSEIVEDAPPEFAVETAQKDVSGPTRSDTIFTPISAAKVYEKLEHLLAEQEEESIVDKSNVSSETVEAKANLNEESTKTSLVTSKVSGKETEKGAKSTDSLEQIDLSRKESLSEVFLGEETSEPPKVPFASPEITQVNEKLGVLDIQSTNANISAPLQFFETRAPSALKAELNLSTNPASSHQPTPYSFFDTVGPTKPVDWTNNIQKFPENPTVVSHQENSLPVASSFFGVDPSRSTKDPVQLVQQQHPLPSQIPVDLSANAERKVDSLPSVSVPFNSTSFDSSYQWNQQPATNSSFPIQQPQFYNPAQFMSGSNIVAPQSADYFSTPTPSPYNQINPHFVSLSSSTHSFNADNSAFVPPSVPIVTSVPEPTGSATLNPVQMSVDPSNIGRSTTETVPPNFHNLATGGQDRRMQYRTVYHHWFYRKEVENKTLWLPFSMQDSLRLEEVHNSSEITPETVVATEGGRYDVDILRRQRSPVYWSGPSNEVRRCSWFYKSPSESRYIPYDESVALKLEEEYKQACISNVWNRKVDINSGEYITFHSPNVLVHYSQGTSPELATSWSTGVGSEDSTYLQGAGSRQRVVKRGVDEFNIDEGEPEKVDHLLFMVHGIGSVCDLKFRSVEEVVDEFRSISLQLIQSHYRSASEQGIVNRIEVLPISWHSTLHEDTGIDKKLQAINLESIPRLRHFTNDTLLDILFYTSPIYCQTIMQTVGNELNRLCALFRKRNPSFEGGIYVGGHSLGSLILFDLLCHQKPASASQMNDSEDEESNDAKDDNSVEPTKPIPPQVFKRRLSKKVSYVMGAAGTGQPYINYPQLSFHPRAFFAMGSPIGMFVTVRGIDTLGEDFVLPTCPAFFNIFHPLDPVAYRIESLITPEAQKFRPMLIPHHKGRKRMHLELKETMARVGADLKQKLLDSVRSTWNSVYQLAMFHKSDNQVLEREIDKVVEEQLQTSPAVPDQSNADDGGENLKIGKLNGGRRIDYVLQEAPFENISGYVFALTSHVCYWESEDTILMMLKEIYGSMGIQTDAQLPQQTLSIERVSTPPPSTPSTTSSLNNSSPSLPLGVDPTAPMSGKPVGPPPKTGFVRKT